MLTLNKEDKHDYIKKINKKKLYLKYSLINFMEGDFYE